MHTSLFRRAAVLVCGLALAGAAHATELTRTIAAVKPSIVGIGSYLKTRSPAIVFNGTGFVVGDGLSVITNAHVAPEIVDSEKLEVVGVVIGEGEHIEFRPALSVTYDKTHDLAHLRIGGQPLPALTLADSSHLAEGQSLAFTGYPLGMVLGLHAATHRAMLAAITPIVMPSMNSQQLNARMIAQLQRPSFSVFQLDGTAYPGNSGSPLYDPETGRVVGVINMVFVKGLKENAITNPSGITYAIPANFIRDFLQHK